MARVTLLALPLFLAIAGCNRPDEGTSISINADSGNMLGAVDGKSGEVKLDVPGFWARSRCRRYSWMPRTST